MPCVVRRSIRSALGDVMTCQTDWLDLSLLVSGCCLWAMMTVTGYAQMDWGAVRFRWGT